MRIYYAHCMAIYDTPQEARDLEFLTRLFPGADIINPNTPDINYSCAAIRAAYEGTTIRAGHEIMEKVFKPLVLSCYALVFRALPDGMIPSGVYKELTWAREVGMGIVELPAAMSRRELTHPQTSEYLREIGQR